MEQGRSSEADRSSASHRVAHILQNPNVRYRVHNSPPLVPCHVMYLYILFNIILQPTPRRFKLSRTIK